MLLFFVMKEIVLTEVNTMYQVSVLHYTE